MGNCDMVEQLKDALERKAEAQALAFLRLKQVKALTGLSRSSIYERMRRGSFPPSVSIGARAVAWTSTSIANWQARQIERSRR
jgi:prophage regulatory protein